MSLLKYQDVAKMYLLIVFVMSTGVFAKQHPNIILILTDDQGYGDINMHGHPLLKTPNMDRLYRESVRFDNFYVSPSCSPTRAALLTGRHEFWNGVTHTISPREHLDLNATILPELLKSAGYRTGFIGKWHLGNGEGYSPNYRGFDWCSTTKRGNLAEFDPEIIRQHQAAGRNVIKGDPMDSDFWDRAETEKYKVELVMLAMSSITENMEVARQLRSIKFPGLIAATARYDDEVEALKKAGVDAAFNIYGEAGAGFAGHICENIDGACKLIK